MSHRNVNQASKPALSQSTAAAALPDRDVTGYLCRNWLPFEDHAGVTINDDAPAGAVLAWCWAEVEALLASARLANMALQVEPGALRNDDAFAKLFLHRLEPLERALHGVIDRLASEADRPH